MSCHKKSPARGGASKGERATASCEVDCRRCRIFRTEEQKILSKRLNIYRERGLAVLSLRYNYRSLKTGLQNRENRAAEQVRLNA
jgi:hypothetical protein